MKLKSTISMGKPCKETEKVKIERNARVELERERWADKGGYVNYHFGLLFIINTSIKPLFQEIYLHAVVLFKEQNHISLLWKL